MPGKRGKFSRDPVTPEELLREQISVLTEQNRLLREMHPTTLHAIDHVNYIDPVQGEVQINWPGRHTPALADDSYVYYHSGKWRVLRRPVFHIKVYGDLQPVVVGADAFIWLMSRDLDDLQLIECECYVTTPGSTHTIQIRNVNTGNNLLSTPMTINSGQKNSKDGAAPVIHPVNSIVEWGQHLSIDVNAGGGGSTGLGVVAIFGGQIDLPV